MMMDHEFLQGRSKRESHGFTLGPAFSCQNKNTKFRRAQWGNYWVLSNYIRAEKKFNCNESITYTTHTEFPFLHNLEPVLERWQGPVSVAMYAPGTNLAPTLDTILYFRDCSPTNLVRDFVSFTIFFDINNTHIPDDIPRPETLLKKRADCSKPESLRDSWISYRKLNNMLYPCNVGRNIAREMVSTHFVLSADIEQYPSYGIIPDFLDMIRRNPPYLRSNVPRVFVTAYFEIEEEYSVPKTKAELVDLYGKGIVIGFQERLCARCHRVPRLDLWLADDASDQMNVMPELTEKRLGVYKRWEPFYIGTNEEPQYDERVMWEAGWDKHDHSYKLCLLDYDFMVLDKAFLVHKPGIKTIPSQNNWRLNSVQRINLQSNINPGIDKVFGAREGCLAASEGATCVGDDC